MNLNTFHRLLSPEGQALLAQAGALRPTATTLLRCQQTLRKSFDDDLVRAAMEVVVARGRAAVKFARAAEMYFTREALEQASGEAVTSHRRSRFAGHRRVADLCCGIGGDALALAETNEVVAVDLDEMRLAITAENLRVHGRTARMVCGDVLTVDLGDCDAAFADPDRRADGRRHLRLAEYAPSVDALRARFPAGFPLGIKVAPGVPQDDLRRLDAEAEFLCVDGELKECMLWFGPLRTVARRATVLPGGATLAADVPAMPRPAGPAQAFVYDPNPAVVRSGLLPNLAEELDAHPLDDGIALLTASTCRPTPFASALAVESALPFDAKGVARHLRSIGVGPAVLVKRGLDVDVDELRRKWKLDGPETRTVIFTRIEGRPSALVTTPVDASTMPSGAA